MAPSSSTSAPGSLARRRLTTVLKPIRLISRMASGVVVPPQAIVDSTWANVEMPAMSFFVTCPADKEAVARATTNRLTIRIMLGMIRQAVPSLGLQSCSSALQDRRPKTETEDP